LPFLRLAAFFSSALALAFDPAKDFVPLMGLRADGLAILVNTSKITATTLKEFIDHAKANPGALSFGTAGMGTAPHFAGELLMAATGIKMVHVPYQGSPPALNGVMSGDIEVMFSPVQMAANAVKSGRGEAGGGAEERFLHRRFQGADEPDRDRRHPDGRRRFQGAHFQRRGRVPEARVGAEHRRQQLTNDRYALPPALR